MKSFLVTGGAGFIGSWLVRELLQREVERVYVLDDLSSGRVKNIQGLSGVEFLQHSILDNLETVIPFKELSGVFHLAAKGDVQESIDDPFLYTNVNICGTQNILEACREHQLPFLMTSTCMVYGLNNLQDSGLKNGIHEKHPAIPISPYGASKLAAENLAISYHYAYNLPVRLARPFNTYGPHQKVDNKEGGVIPIFLKRKQENQNLTVYGSGEQRRDFLYVKDCANFLAQYFFAETAPLILNAGSGKSISILELAQMVSDNSLEIQFESHPHPRSEVMELLCDSSLVKDSLGWSPKFSLQEGLRENYEWLEKENES